MFSASRPLFVSSPPPLAGTSAAVGGRKEGNGSRISPLQSARRRLPLPNGEGSLAALSLRRAQFRLHLVEQFLDLGAFELGDVILIFEQHAERVGDSSRIERHHIEFSQRAGPIERFGDAWRLEQILLT